MLLKNGKTTPDAIEIQTFAGQMPIDGIRTDNFQFVGGIGNLHGRDEFLPYRWKIKLQ